MEGEVREQVEEVVVRVAEDKEEEEEVIGQAGGRRN